MTEPVIVARQDEFYSKFLSKPKISSLGKQANRVAKLIDIHLNDETDELLRIVDEYDDGNIILIHYLTPDPEVAHVRGIIIDLETESIVCPTYPFEPEENYESYISSENFSENIKKVNEAVLAREGTLVRVWFSLRLNTWFFSTFKRIEGQHSRWSGKPFGDLFFDIIDETLFWSLVSKSKNKKVFAFLLSHPDNRIVCDVDPQIMLVGISDGNRSAFQIPNNKNLTVNFPESIDIARPYPLSKIDWNNNESLKSLLNPDEVAGLTLRFQDGTSHRLMSPVYQRKRELRGNEPFLSDRWVVLYKEGKEKELEEAYNDEHSTVIFERARKSVTQELPEMLFSFYNRRYIHPEKYFLWLPPQEHYIIKTIHEKLTETKKEKNKNEVMRELSSCLDKSSAKQLNTFRYRKRNKVYWSTCPITGLNTKN